VSISRLAPVLSSVHAFLVDLRYEMYGAVTGIGLRWVFQVSKNLRCETGEDSVESGSTAFSGLLSSRTVGPRGRECCVA